MGEGHRGHKNAYMFGTNIALRCVLKNKPRKVNSKSVPVLTVRIVFMKL